jgi:hypothetical protein
MPCVVLHAFRDALGFCAVVDLYEDQGARGNLRREVPDKGHSRVHVQCRAPAVFPAGNHYTDVLGLDRVAVEDEEGGVVLRGQFHCLPGLAIDQHHPPRQLRRRGRQLRRPLNCELRCSWYCPPVREVKRPQGPPGPAGRWQILCIPCIPSIPAIRCRRRDGRISPGTAPRRRYPGAGWPRVL